MYQASSPSFAWPVMVTLPALRQITPRELPSTRIVASRSIACDEQDQPFGALVNAVRQGLRHFSLSLTAISSHSQACFAQLSAMLAHERAMRDLRRAQAALAASCLPNSGQAVEEPLEEPVFVESARRWWHGLNAANNFWRSVYAPCTSNVARPMSPWGGDPAMSWPAAAHWQFAAMTLPLLAAGFMLSFAQFNPFA